MATDEATAIEFGHWSTPFEDCEVSIVSVAFGNVSAATPTGLAGEGALTIRIIASDTGALYEIYFSRISGYRVLDEHGLLDFWEPGKSTKTTFRVRNHPWATESPLTFFHGGEWSRVIATDWWCVEVISKEDPKITDIGKR